VLAIEGLLADSSEELATTQTFQQDITSRTGIRRASHQPHHSDPYKRLWSFLMVLWLINEKSEEILLCPIALCQPSEDSPLRPSCFTSAKKKKGRILSRVHKLHSRNAMQMCCRQHYDRA